MEGTELLDALDRRARRAVSALDAGLGDAEPAPLPIDAGGGRRRPWVPLLVAAALVVVALVGIGLALDARDDEQGTVADDRDVPVETGADVTGFALPEPEALGYEVRAAFDGPSVAVDPASGQPGPPYTAHGPTGSDDPWQQAIVTQTTPWDDRVYGGELIDLGGIEGLYRTSGSSQQIAWQDGDTARTLMSSALDRDALVEVAREAVAAGWSADGPLPGHDVLHEGTYDQFSPVIEYGASVRSDWQGVAYDATSGDDDIVVGWRPGGPGLLGALHVFSDEVERVEVDGQGISVSRSTVGGPSHASWQPVEGTVVALVTYGDIDAVLRRVVPGLNPIDAAAFDAMVGAHPASPELALLDAPASSFEAEGEPLASIEIPDRAGFTYRLRILEDDDARYALMQEIAEGNGTSGSGGPLADLSTTALQSGSLSNEETGSGTPVIVSGVLPDGVAPDLSTARFVDRTTGAEVAVLDFLTGSIPGSSRLLGLVLLDADPTAAIDATFQTADGERTWRL
ncbi:hypothetical protein NHL50_10665 [Acidimicrobiia bacterium EGI L10123]|uniref:hypothetical protein n=1 Tax=Salinilacustrithrix flava TaxID=2957203 RepID=UPI003D7C17DB|nr:hypothetical protein [Acidimicrobiia bacterium EGI L10123]